MTATLAWQPAHGPPLWPPQPEDMTEAEALCHELGLGDLLERMPARAAACSGAVTPAGACSPHGEQSRLLPGRAPCCKGSWRRRPRRAFAALDPGTLRLALRRVLERAATHAGHRPHPCRRVSLALVWYASPRVLLRCGRSFLLLCGVW